MRCLNIFRAKPITPAGSGLPAETTTVQEVPRALGHESQAFFPTIAVDLSPLSCRTCFEGDQKDLFPVNQRWDDEIREAQIYQNRYREYFMGNNGF